MLLTKEEHERWHRQPRALTPDEHKALMKRMGVSEREDREWHKQHESPPAKTARKPSGEPVNCFAIGGGFLRYCVQQKWLTSEGKGRSTRYFVTQQGRKALKGFGIEV
jgi:hypothetical protein